MSTALTHAEDTQITASNGRIALEPNPRRIRAFFAGHAVADTTRSVYLFERGRLPMYYIPLADVRTEFLVPTSTTTHCPWKGDATYWTIEIGDRRAEDAVWTYPEQFDGSLDLSEYVAFYWDRMDAWYEEDQQVFVHARDPYVRIDALPSSRHVQVFVGDVLVAETRRPRLLFETGLPTRYYIPRIDVRSEYFAPSPTTTACPYKALRRICRSPAQPNSLRSRIWRGSIRSLPPKRPGSTTTCRSFPNASARSWWTVPKSERCWSREGVGAYPTATGDCGIRSSAVSSRRSCTHTIAVATEKTNPAMHTPFQPYDFHTTDPTAEPTAAPTK